ncbi:uncharacterized protein LOC132951241 [Metopolophium dirhodum]|uniref:uncharacterized protein LOC132951241 n=1 Tax=Metopolophium dirhodum TaxID=44670 RepID=UPI0029900770|nr:uncharacterized protein LOC132951241 [Metopolophium dirhodum]
MYSKRIVISIIVIGCLAHFITCPNTVDDKKQNSKSPSKTPVKAALQQGKPSTSRAPVRPRGLSPNNNADSKINGKAKSPTKPAAGKPMKPPAADKKKEPAENTADNPDGDGEEPAEEIRPSRLRRFFRRINNFRKKTCPFRFVGRLVKKGLGSILPKPTDDEK